MGGIEAEDDRVSINWGPIVSVMDDDYGDTRWESSGVAARWSPHIGWHGAFS